MPSLLIWRLGALGDSVLLLPTLAALRAAFPAHEIVAAGAPSSLAPARWSGLVNTLLDAASPRYAALGAGAAPPAGALPNDLELAIVWSAHHAEIGCGLVQAGVRRIITAPAVPGDRTPVAAFYLNTVAPLGVRPAPFTLATPPEALAATESAWRRTLSQHSSPVALLHPGAGSRLKQWPLDAFVRLAAKLRADGAAALWSLGPADEALTERLTAAGEGPHLLPPTDVAGLTAYVSRCAALVCADSGVAHLAALMNVPTVTLFGPTDCAVWGPPGPHSVTLSLALPCAPCNELARSCPSRICLRALPVEAVYAAVRAHLRVQKQPTTSDTDPPAAPLWPSAFRSPRPAPAPPAPLQASKWAGGHNWAERAWTAQR